MKKSYRGTKCTCDNSECDGGAVAEAAIAAFRRRWTRDYLSYSDLKSEATRTLWYCHKMFNPNRGTRFESYAYQAILFNLRKEYCRFGPEYLRFKIFKKIKFFNSRKASEKLASPDSSIEDALDLKFRMEKLKNKLKRKEIIDMLYEGYSCSEIGNKLGTSKQNIHQIVKRLQKIQ